MTTTYTKESSTSTTYKDEAMGLPIYCDNDVILCNSEEYDCTGARIMHPYSHTTTTMAKEAYS